MKGLIKKTASETFLKYFLSEADYLAPLAEKGLGVYTGRRPGIALGIEIE